jgi:hypothetical protein
MKALFDTLTKVEYALATLLASQAVIVAFFPQTPVFVEWVSRAFGVIGVLTAVIKAVLAVQPPGTAVVVPPKVP